MPQSAGDAYDELYAYTMGHGRQLFILQHVVDAHAAQEADEHSKPIGVIFALVGLYLHVEAGFSGRQVQQVHMQLGRAKTQWPKLTLPKERGSIHPSDVIVAPAGVERDAMIDAWCRDVWTAYAGVRSEIVELLRLARA